MSKPNTEPGELRSEFASDPEMAELVEFFVSEMPERVEEIAASWRDQQMDVLRSFAHQLKGAGGGYGFPALSEAAGEVEKAILAEKDLDAMKSDVHALLDICRRVTV